MNSGQSLRMGTGQRLSTAQRQANYEGVGFKYQNQLSSEVQDRPVTQQGIAGMRARTGGMGRQVQDSSYWFGKLNQKVSEIRSETENINEKIESSIQKKRDVKKFNRQFEDLMADVRDLEGTLADYNLAYDKARAQQDPTEIEMYLEGLMEKNGRMTEEQNAVFMEKTNLESRIDAILRKQKELQQGCAEKIQMLGDPVKMNKYNEIIRASEMLKGEANQLQMMRDNLAHELQEKENALKSDGFREQFHFRFKELERTRTQIEQLERELNAAKTQDPDTIAKNLTDQVKEYKEMASSMKKQTKKTKKAVRELEEQLDGMREEVRRLESSDGSAEDNARKIELWKKKDMEFTDFLRKFPDNLKAGQKQKRETEASILLLLELISKDISRKDFLPSAKEAKAMKDDLSFAEKRLQNSKGTQDKLQVELQNCQADLLKIKDLDSKMAMELATHKKRIEEMQKAIVEYEDLEALKTEAKRVTEYHEDILALYARRKDAASKLMTSTQDTRDQLEQKIKSNPEYHGMKTTEQRIQKQEMKIHRTKEEVISFEKESDYHVIKEECMRLCSRINTNNLNNCDRY